MLHTSNGETPDEGVACLKRRTGGEVAEAIYFLAGERAAFITGQVLSVNGGMVIG